MNFFQTFKYALSALKREDELSLAYLYGQKIEQLPHIKNAKGRYQGLFFRVLIFFRFLWVSFSFKSNGYQETEVLFFSGTDNQFNSLASTKKSLDKQSIDSYFLLGRGVGERNKSTFKKTVLMEFSISIVLVALCLFFLKAPALYWRLKKQSRHIEIKQYFNVFCEVYAYLPYFIKYLSNSKPTLVVMSNDHNAPNRALRLAAEILDIKTLYMQHASVSDLFPPLKFDYALLDGKVALETYSKCLELTKNLSLRDLDCVTNCQIMLTGQKKPVKMSRVVRKPAFLAGIAVNSLDDFESVLPVLQMFVGSNEKCIVRTHPCQPSVFLNQLQEFIKENPSVKWSDSSRDSLVGFFEEIESVIAANTSLHLEAALAGLPTFYLEMSKEVQLSDYYGYVRNGVSNMLEPDFTLADIRDGIDEGGDESHKTAIVNYSETYATKWQNSEGELSALVIDHILNNTPLNEVFDASTLSDYGVVMNLKRCK